MCRRDFSSSKKKSQSKESFYDFFDDFDLIESSIAKQYGIRIRREASTMSWSEFRSLLAGLMEDTPLARIIQIRSETNTKNLTPDQQMIRADWRKKQSKHVSQDDYDSAMKGFEEMFRSM